MTDKLTPAAQNRQFKKILLFVTCVMLGPTSLFHAFRALSQNEFIVRHGRIVTAIGNPTEFYTGVSFRLLMGIWLTSVLAWLVIGYFRSRRK